MRCQKNLSKSEYDTKIDIYHFKAKKKIVEENVKRLLNGHSSFQILPNMLKVMQHAVYVRISIIFYKYYSIYTYVVEQFKKKHNELLLEYSFLWLD